ncbi:hypothetical protein DL96DRAFT_1623161, partial [Flagelloscypha sp. PMI_526]
MKSLPFDLYPQILASLPRSTLQSCLLVNSDLHDLAQEVVFEHLVLQSMTWERTHTFLMTGKGAQLRRCIKKLTIKVDEMPIYGSLAKVQPTRELFIKFIVMLSPQITKLGLHGQRETNDEQPCTDWAELHSDFRQTLVVHVFPNIHHLEMHELTQIPLLDILHHCLVLDELYLGSDADNISSSQPPEGFIKLPSLSFISFGIFGDVDFEPDTGISRYLREVTKTPTSLQLGRYFGTNNFDLNLSFLANFGLFQQHLLHLSLGCHVYDTVVKLKEAGSCSTLPLSSLPQLRTLAFSLNTRSQTVKWNLWSVWIARHFDTIHPSLKTLAFNEVGRASHDFDHLPELDSLATDSIFQIDCAFTTKENRFSSKYQKTMDYLRRELLSWHAKGKLRFWF